MARIPAWQIVLHVVNHATLHRGQVMGMLWHARGLQAAYLVPVACYAAVALYAWLFAEARAGEASV